MQYSNVMGRSFVLSFCVIDKPRQSNIIMSCRIPQRIKRKYKQIKCKQQVGANQQSFGAEFFTVRNLILYSGFVDFIVSCGWIRNQNKFQPQTDIERNPYINIMAYDSIPHEYLQAINMLVIGSMCVTSNLISM